MRIINKHSQLALRMDTDSCFDRFSNTVDQLLAYKLKKYGKIEMTGSSLEGVKKIPYGADFYYSIYDFLVPDNRSKLFLIQPSAFEKSKTIDLNDAFSSTIFRKIPRGVYTYLLGANKMFKYTISGNVLVGYYYEDLNKIISPFAFKTDDPTINKNYVFNKMGDYFMKILKLLIYIELGEIEVTVVEPGESHKRRNEEDIKNDTDNNVYVVDSAWNKYSVRLEGFGVKGHYRLQACGEGFMDRKLIWINNFKKSGYIRKPRAFAHIKD